MLIVWVRPHHCAESYRPYYGLVRTSDTTGVPAKQLRHSKHQLHLHETQRHEVPDLCVFLKSTNVKCKKEAPVNPKWVIHQFLCIFSFILSPDTYYFLQSHCRNSSHCLTSLDRTEEENEVIGLRPQWAKKSGWKTIQRIKREITSPGTAHLFFL